MHTMQVELKCHGSPNVACNVHGVQATYIHLHASLRLAAACLFACSCLKVHGCSCTLHASCPHVARNAHERYTAATISTTHTWKPKTASLTETPEACLVGVLGKTLRVARCALEESSPCRKHIWVAVLPQHRCVLNYVR